MIVTLKWLKEAFPAKKAVLVTGGFDPLHYGHTRFIKSAVRLAKEIGLQAVVVGVAPDVYIARKHPVLQTLDHRMEMMDALEGVDFVIPQEEETAASAIRAVRPAIFLKGDDWQKRGLPQAELDALKETGAAVAYVPINPVSSSDILREYFWKQADELGGRS